MQVRTLLLGFCAIIFPVSGGFSQTSEKAVCGAFFGTICTSPDNAVRYQQKKIIDFSINEVDLGGARVTMYHGIGLSAQQGLTGLAVQDSYTSGPVDVRVTTASSARGKYFDVHVARKDTWGVVQIFGYVDSSAKAEKIGKFISGIHSCGDWKSADSCSRDLPLERAGVLVSKLTP